MSTQPQETQALATRQGTSPLVLELAGDWKIDPVTMINTLKATIFPVKDRNDKPFVVTNEMMVAFLQVCNTYKLNPFVKEIYAFPTKGGGVVPMVPIDGWANIINRNTNFDGLEFVDSWETIDNKKSLFSTTCIIYRKDRAHPIKVTEYLSECYDSSKEPWRRWPARMLRHKATIQCARLAFSLGGIYDPDEAERIAENGDKPEPAKPGRVSTQVIEGSVQRDTSSSPAQQTATVVSSGGGTTQAAAAAKSEASASPSQPQKGEAAPTRTHEQVASPGNSDCICNCCKAGSCDCASKDEMDQCGCSACMTAVKTPEPSASPTAGEVFGGDEFQQAMAEPEATSKPAGPYVPQEKLRRLFVHAAAANIEVVKGSHDDKLHKVLKERWNIDSIKEIPVGLFEEVLDSIAPNLKAAKGKK